VSLTFPKSARLSRSSEFLRVKTEGKACTGRYLTLGALGGCPDSRIGLITTKRLGNAVQRNRVRRRLRELARLSRPEWTPGVWFVAIARSAAVKATFAELQTEWNRLAIRAGILKS